MPALSYSSIQGAERTTFGLAATALQPGFMPRTLCYWCIPGKESSGVAFRDISVKGNHATIEPGNTSGAFATENMMSTTAASAGGLFIYPAGVPIDFSVDSILVSVVMKRATPTVNEVIMSIGSGANTVSAPGIYLSHRIGGFCRISFNIGNGTIVSAADSLATFSDATGSKEYTVAIAYDAPTRSLYMYRNGILDNVSSGLLTGANALVSGTSLYGPRLGGIGTAVHLGATGTAVSGAFRGWQGYIAKGRGLPINVSQIASLLAENPTALLTDNEFRFVD